MSAQECNLFTPVYGGLGAFLACTTSTARVAIPNPRSGSIYCVNNLGLVPVFLAFGDGAIVATTSYMAFPPGLAYVAIPNAGGSGAPTYVAGITASSTADVQISIGDMVV